MYNTKDIKQKFIISQSGRYKQGRVALHLDLDKNAKSGGYWFYDRDENVMYLYGKSEDFGQFTKEQIEADMDWVIMRLPKGVEVRIDDESKYTLAEFLMEHMDVDRADELISKNDFV